MDGDTGIRRTLELADWRRRIAELYATIRERSATDPEAAHAHWRAVREALYRTHSQSPVPEADRAGFRALHFPYDAALRFGPLPVQPSVADSTSTAPLGLPDSGTESRAVRKVGTIAVPFAAGPAELSVFWMLDYAGGLLLPFVDGTSGTETYGAGRYLLDAAKGADLGGDPSAATVVIDFNFAYQPSCAFDPRWACPLAPPENRLAIPIRAGERLR